jgi:hypothetical protein
MVQHQGGVQHAVAVLGFEQLDAASGYVPRWSLSTGWPAAAQAVNPPSR